MGIKYGFCNDVKSRRINLGKTTLVCGTQAYIYSTDLSGTITKSDIGVMPLTEITSLLCADSFFAQSVSYNATVQNNPLMIGCCADHLDHQDGYLINTAIGGVSTSREHVISVNGQGEPWSVSKDDVITALTAAAAVLTSINIPPPPNGTYVPSSIDSNMPGDSWQQGSASWTQFEGLGSDMEIVGGTISSTEKEYSLTANANTGRVDGSVSKNAYYSSGTSIPCDPVLASATVETFAEALNGLDLS